MGLLLGLTQVVGLNYPLLVVGSASWFDRGREPVFDTHTVSFLTRSMQFDPARAAPLKFLVFDFALTAHSIGPPGQQTYGRRAELMGRSLSCRSKPATQSNAVGPFFAKLLAQPAQI
jgi:hypothetical protein